MITEALISVFTTVLGVVLGTVPSLPVPGWLAEGPGFVAAVMGTAGAFSFWVPLRLLGVVVAVIVAALLVGLGVKLARILASFLTLGGGGAG